jgi:hypothetical protein
MKLFLKILCPTMLCAFGYAQSTQTAVTQDQLQYFRFMLMNLASLDHDQNSTNAFEASLVPTFGLNAQEAAAIHTAASSLHALLKQIRQSSQAVIAGKTSLSAADLSALSNLATQRETLLATLANQIASSVRPQTAARLEMAGTIVANAQRASQRGK